MPQVIIPVLAGAAAGAVWGTVVGQIVSLVTAPLQDTSPRRSPAVTADKLVAGEPEETA